MTSRRILIAIRGRADRDRHPDGQLAVHRRPNRVGAGAAIRPAPPRGARAGSVGQATVCRERRVLRQPRARFRAAGPEEVIVSDQKRLVSTATPATASSIRCCSTRRSARRRACAPGFSAIVNGSLRRVLGNVTLSDILSVKRAGIMIQIRDEVADEAKNFGITVVDVRLRAPTCPRRTARRSMPA